MKAMKVKLLQSSQTSERKPSGWDREENISHFQVQRLSEDSEGKKDYSRTTVQHISEAKIGQFIVL